jgi:glycosyltransferase involved in cell wall biosynthesis
MQIMPEFGLAGAEIMCENLCYELSNFGHEVLVVSLYDFKTIITNRIESRNIKIVFLGKKRGLDISLIRKLKKVIHTFAPDVIHMHRYVMAYAIPASIGFNVRKIHTIHNIAASETNWLHKFINKICYTFNDVTPVALSKIIQDSIVKTYHISKDKIPIINNGIDLSKCNPKSNYRINDNFIILHIGRFVEQKNHEGVIKTFKIFHDRHPQSILQLIGNGGLFENIKTQVIQQDLIQYVEFLGPQDNVYSFLHNADVFFLPSKFEGMPITLIEALGTGLPVIATPVGGIPDMLEDIENAIIVDNVPELLANQLERLYLSESLRKYYGLNLLNNSTKFSAEKMAVEYIKLMDEHP